MITLILCAGDQTRWGDFYHPKQLVDIGGEPLLFRYREDMVKTDDLLAVISGTVASESLKEEARRELDRRLNRTTSKRREEEASRVVYLVKAENGLYKIGHTKNLRDRISGLFNQSPVVLTLICSIESDSAPQLEQELHGKFANKRLHGEWFELGPDDVAYIKELSQVVGK